MSSRIVIVTTVYDQADILSEYLQWHLDLGVDFIVAMDFKSTDGSQDILSAFERSGKVSWFTLPERDMKKYNVANTLLTMARDDFHADWIIFCDVDEFLCVEGGTLREVLQDAEDRNRTILNVPGFNMTGPPIEPGQSAPEILTLRIDKPVVESFLERTTGYLRAPQIFIRHAPKTIVRASAIIAYGSGAHSATAAWGESEADARLRFLHYSIRGFDKLLLKAKNTEAWFKDNPPFTLNWGWHWRRYARLKKTGNLRADYDKQFVTPDRAAKLIRKGICAVDETVARWAKARNASHQAPASGLNE